MLIVIVNFNGEKFLKKCLDSLLIQDYRQKKILVIDNGSSDRSLEIIKKYETVELIVNKVNNGYSGAADQACHLAGERAAEFVMILNPDIIFTKNYLSLVIAAFCSDEKIAAAQGKLLKYDFDNDREINVIDSTGLYCFKNRRIIDRGQGLEDDGRFDRSEEVFGITGACPVMRLSALEDIKIGDEYYDRDFFMYKEDIDISWRFLLAGWKNWYEAAAVAYHGRGTGVLKRFTHLDVLKSRSVLPKFTKHHSYKNQRMMQIKNEIPSLFFRNIFPIFFKEILITAYICFREPFLMKSFWAMLKLMPKMLKKRDAIQKKRKEKGIKAADLERWFA